MFIVSRPVNLFIRWTDSEECRTKQGATHFLAFSKHEGTICWFSWKRRFVITGNVEMGVSFMCSVKRQYYEEYLPVYLISNSCHEGFFNLGCTRCLAVWLASRKVLETNMKLFSCRFEQKLVQIKRPFVSSHYLFWGAYNSKTTRRKRFLY